VGAARRADARGVDIRLGDRLRRVLERLGDPVVGGERFGRLAVEVHAGDQIGAVDRGDGLRVGVADARAADDPVPKCASHALPARGHP
jgi:hypothetical protein